jgi:plasmid maintenance system antidote protein VapI
MGDTNYLASIIKILEKPIQTVINDKIITTEFRVQLAQVRNTRIVKLVFGVI